MSWRKKFDNFLRKPSRQRGDKIRELEDFIDDTTMGRPLRLKGYDDRHVPLGEQGLVYFDKTNKKVKIYIDETGKWGDLSYTTTSTSTSTTTSTSTSTTT